MHPPGAHLDKQHGVVESGRGAGGHCELGQDSAGVGREERGRTHHPQGPHRLGLFGVVEPGRFDYAMAALTACGFGRVAPQLRRGFDGRFGKGTTLVAPDGHELDLHRTFVAGRFGVTVDVDALFDTATPFDLGDRTLLALGPAERFLHACYHAVLGPRRPGLRSLRDVFPALQQTTIAFPYQTEAWLSERIG